MEDLDLEDDQGVDVRGIVPWDDGLTNKERERGGRRVVVVSGREMMEEGRFGESLEGAAARKRERERAQQGGGVEGVVEQVQEVQAQEQPRRKPKRWLGIW